MLPVLATAAVAARSARPTYDLDPPRMLDAPEGRYVFAVAQLPFETESRETSVVNMFGTLVPLLDSDGRALDQQALRAQFPNRCLAWWLLRPGARAFAEPGRLVSAYVEPAVRFDRGDPDKDAFQVIVDTVEPVREREAVEILTVSDEAVTRLQDLVSRADLVTHDHPPTDLVLVRWRRLLYGPFRASGARRDDGRWQVTLQSAARDATVLSLPDEGLLRIGERYQSYRHVDVSLEGQPPQPPHRSTRRRTCTYELVVGGLEALRALPHDVLSVARDVDVIKRYAAQFFGRRDRQQLAALLDRLAPELASGAAAGGDVKAVVEGARAQLAADEASARAVADALVASGVLGGAVDAQIEARVERYVAENAARLQADIAAQLRDGEAAVGRLRDQRDQLEEELKRRSREAEAALEQDLAALTAAHTEQIEAERAAVSEARQALEAERDLVARHLEAVTARYETARAEVFRDFSTVWPLFARVASGGSVSGTTALDGGRPPTVAGVSDYASRRRTDAQPIGDELQPLAFPAFVHQPVETERAALAEEVFFERFRAHTRARGFAYAAVDLVAFHLSVKCGDLTILGGVSGTGKSTLPRLYAEALMGEETEATDEARGRYLHVAVRPSWLDQDDLLGHVNTLDGRYVPSESGLFPLLVRAQEEYARRGPASGAYVSCLDEMNLAHVEHYLAGVLQALERGDGLRRVPVFDPGGVRPIDPYARWATLDLPPTLRFVGTVNYDETTKPLSRRLLDRANVIELRAAGDYDFGPPRSDRVRPIADGPAVSGRDLRAWVHDRSLDVRFAEVLDALRAPLLALQCPLTPRRFRAVSRFVASANGLCTPDVAFDLQVCQRVLPQVRGIYGPTEREALEQLTAVVAARGFLPESGRMLAALTARELGLPA